MSDLEDSEIENLANAALSTVVPAKSKRAYEAAYKTFKDWCGEKKCQTTSEKVMLAYFQIKSEHYKPNTLWCEYSKLRTMIHLNERIDISSFLPLIGFLKRLSKGYKPKKSKPFEGDDIDRFFRDADDENFLLMKTALIVGVAGACRRCELTNLTVNDVKDLGDIMVVDVNATKTYVDRQFVINEGVVENVNLLEIIRKYLALRSRITTTDRFFLGYRKGKCVAQPVGINTIGAIPSKIAQFLGYQDHELYTGHCFRRTSASRLVEAGACTIALKQHGGWESSKVAESYVVSSLNNKRKIADGIFGKRFCPSTGITPREPTEPNVVASTNVVPVSTASSSNTTRTLNTNDIPVQSSSSSTISIASANVVPVSTLPTLDATGALNTAVNAAAQSSSSSTASMADAYVRTVVHSQEIRVASAQSAEGHQAVANRPSEEGNEFWQMFIRSTSGFNMNNCNVNFNIGGNGGNGGNK